MPVSKVCGENESDPMKEVWRESWIHMKVYNASDVWVGASGIWLSRNQDQYPRKWCFRKMKAQGKSLDNYVLSSTKEAWESCLNFLKTGNLPFRENNSHAVSILTILDQQHSLSNGTLFRLLYFFKLTHIKESREELDSISQIVQLFPSGLELRSALTQLTPFKWR